MKAKDFFPKQEIQLPLIRGENDFCQYISSVIDNYIDLLSRISGKDGISLFVTNHTNDAKRLCRSIKKTVDDYLNGHPYEAYDDLKPELDSFKPLLEQLWVPKVGDVKTNRLYRMRLGCNTDISRKEIFHIPFDQRHIVSTQRYSIPGLPCLYLGGSLYTCWREMGSPNFEDIHVSAFVVNCEPGLKFLDFSKTPNWIANWLVQKSDTLNDDQNRFLSAQIVLWPLIAACSIKSLYPKANFKPEYIIPQMLLQWLTKNITDFDGIRHFSTHVEDTTTDNPHWICNYILPVRQVNHSGYCERLKQSFRFTKPHLWRLLRVVNLNTRDSFMRDDFEIELVSGVKEKYENTEFGKVQWNLNCIMQSQAEMLTR